jgi:hypothetical protein
MLTAWGGGNLLVMNAAEPGLQGSTQGLMSVVQALSMATLPTVGGTLWNASLAFPGAWHAGFCYACLGVLGLGMIWLSLKLPPSLEQTKT